MKDSKTMAMALAAAAGPAMGVGAFVGWLMSLNLIRFMLVERIDYDGKRKAEWMTDSGMSMWRDRHGETRNKAPSDVVIDTKHAGHFTDLDWKRTHLYVADGTSGWLSPEGEYFGCNYGGHGNLAYWVLKQDYCVMEKAGWCHVDCEGKKGRSTYRYVVPLTAAQEKWLESNGHDLDPWGQKARQKEAETIQLGEYTLDAKADREAYERMMARAPVRKAAY